MSTYTCILDCSKAFRTNVLVILKALFKIKNTLLPLLTLEPLHKLRSCRKATPYNSLNQKLRQSDVCVGNIAKN